MRLRTCRAGGLVAGLFLASPSALGQSQALQDRAAAQQLFNDALVAMAAHDYATACPKLEEVTRLQPGKIGAMHRLASCYEAWGKVMSAWAAYQLVAATAPVTDPLKSASADRVVALEPKLPRLTVQVSAAARAAAGLEVKRDGLLVGAAQWGVPIPVDPGPHTVAASAAQKKAWSLTVEVAPETPAKIEVPALVDDVPDGTVGPPSPQPPAGAAPITTDAGGPPPWAWVVGGVGLAAGVAGFVFLGTSIAGQNDIYAKCGPGKPDDQAMCNALGAQNNVRQGLAWALGGVGALGLGAGIIGIATAHPRKQGPAIRVVPTFSAYGAGASWGGTF